VLARGRGSAQELAASAAEAAEGAAATAAAVRGSGLRCLRFRAHTSPWKTIRADIVMLTMVVLVGVVLFMPLVSN